MFCEKSFDVFAETVPSAESIFHSGGKENAPVALDNVNASIPTEPGVRD